MAAGNQLKPLVFVGSSKTDLSDFPQSVKYGIGFALEQAQLGRKSDKAKPLKGFGGAGVVEIMEKQRAGWSYIRP